MIRVTFGLKTFHLRHMFVLLVSPLISFQIFSFDLVSRRHPPTDVTLQTESGMNCVLLLVSCAAAGPMQAGKKICEHVSQPEAG